MLAGLFQAPLIGLAILAVAPHLLVLLRLKKMKALIAGVEQVRGRSVSWETVVSGIS
jgi:hypothetical protein